MRDSLSENIYAEAKALAGFNWDAAEASARLRVVSDEIRAECETLLALPEWDSQPVPVGV